MTSNRERGSGAADTAVMSKIDIPPAPELPQRVHLFDARASNRVEGVVVMYSGETWRDAKSSIPDEDGTPPALAGATKTEDGWRDADLSKDLTATLEPDDEAGLRYLGTLQESGGEIARILSEMPRPETQFALRYGSEIADNQSRHVMDWAARIAKAVQEVEDGE